jgi:hypothetical protein
MRIKLDQRWTDRLVNFTESGMGYQRVDVRFADGRELKDMIVFNAEDLEVPDNVKDATITDLQPHTA